VPRPKGEPAVPIEMPRTEGDLDALMKAVEAHMYEGHRLGELFSEGKLTSDQVLDEAARADEKLYNIMDTIAQEREADLEAAKAADSS
jgi:hypothetical protein